MSMFPKKYLIECLIATIVLIILTLVMFPRFQNAQILAKVAKAKQDLADITKAMRAYNIDEEGYGLQYVFIVGNQAGTSIQSMNVGTLITPETGSHDFYGLNSTTLPPTTLKPYLTSYPIPKLPLEIIGKHGNPHFYRVIRKQERLNELNLWDTPSLFPCILFEQSMDHEYLGMASGPFIEYTKNTMEPLNGLKYYLPYNPSNGIMSYGLIFYLSD